tara:strand:+ start:161 stop:913 length:753 start_codon:yes stop_codon:yes gene_type:complete
MKLITIFINIIYISAYSPNLFKKLKIINNKNHDNKNAVIFFSGGGSSMSPSLYSNFHRKLNEKNITVYKPPINYKYKDELINYLHDKYNKVIVTAHSSGCSSAIRFCSNSSKIRNLVFLDPIDTFIKLNKIYINNIDNLLIIYADKSYKITYSPFGLPFLFFGVLNESKLVSKNKLKIYRDYYLDSGHCDILDLFYSNLMHYSRISVGYPVRNIKKMNEYHENISSKINDFMNIKIEVQKEPVFWADILF